MRRQTVVARGEAILPGSSREAPGPGAQLLPSPKELPAALKPGPFLSTSDFAPNKKEGLVLALAQLGRERRRKTPL